MPKRNKLYYNHLLENTNVQVFLLTIRKAEVGIGDRGFTALTGMTKHFTDTTRHAKEKNHDAAGAFQIQIKTGNEAREALSLPDFGRKSQSLAAVYELGFYKALDDIVAGNFVAAINKSNRVWRGLPGATIDRHNHPTLTIDEALAFFKMNGGIVKNVGAGIINNGEKYSDVNFVTYLSGINQVAKDTLRLMNEYNTRNNGMPPQLMIDLLGKMTNYERLLQKPHTATEKIDDLFQKQLQFAPKTVDTTGAKTNKRSAKKVRGKSGQTGSILMDIYRGNTIGWESNYNIPQQLPVKAENDFLSLPIQFLPAFYGGVSAPPLLENSSRTVYSGPVNGAASRQESAVQEWVKSTFNGGTGVSEPFNVAGDTDSSKYSNTPTQRKSKSNEHGTVDFLPQIKSHAAVAESQQAGTSRQVTINLNKALIEHFTIHVNEMKEGTNDIRRKVEEALLEILNNV